MDYLWVCFFYLFSLVFSHVVLSFGMSHNLNFQVLYRKLVQASGDTFLQRGSSFFLLGQYSINPNPTRNHDKSRKSCKPWYKAHSTFDLPWPSEFSNDNLGCSPDSLLLAGSEFNLCFIRPLLNFVFSQRALQFCKFSERKLHMLEASVYLYQKLSWFLSPRSKT